MGKKRKKGLFEELLKRFKKQVNKKGCPSHKRGIPYKSYTAEEKLQILNELKDSGAPVAVFAKWKGIATNTIVNWVNIRKTEGDAGLASKSRRLENTLPPETIQKIIQLKKDNPQWGGAKIADYLARHDFVKISHSGILTILKQNPETKDLIADSFGPKNSKPYEPKRFERSKPRQMYQMDITNWHLKGLYNVYIIGCIDDYSRYMVSWGIFRRQTSEHCIDVLRGAIEQFNSTPEEVLTDNGRQFYTWRGKNIFQKFLLKMGIRHIRSRPYHPQTLGKIESFWRNMYQELLSRETITGFEDLQAKMKSWIDRYNFKRPHQGIGGLVPADRFFGVEKQMKEAMLEGAGMVKNALVVDPYKLTRPMYLIGRIGDKEIRVMAKDGSVIVQGVESMEKHVEKETKLKTLQEKPLQLESPDKTNNSGEDNAKQIQSSDISQDQDSSGSIGLEQPKNGQTDMSGTQDKQTDLLPMGEENNRGDGELVNPAEERTQEQGLRCSGKTGEGNPETEKSDEEITEEGEKTTERKRINQG